MCSWRLSCTLKEFDTAQSLIAIDGSPYYRSCSMSNVITLIQSQRVETLVHFCSRLASNSHALSSTLSHSHPLLFSFGLRLLRTVIDSRALSKSLNSPSLSFSFGLKLSCTLIDSHSLSKSLNSRPLLLSFNLKLSCTLIDSHTFSNKVNSRPLSFSFNLKLSCTLIDSHTFSNKFKLSSTLALV